MRLRGLVALRVASMRRRIDRRRLACGVRVATRVDDERAARRHTRLRSRRDGAQKPVKSGREKNCRALVRAQPLEGPVFFVYFVLDRDGVWRISAM
jgi:hypothetical protein